MMIRFKLFRPRRTSVILLLLAISFAVRAQQEPFKIKYLLAMSHPSSHLFEVRIEVEIPANADTESVDFQMPKSAPGRYAVFDFAKNGQEFHAAGAICPADDIAGSLPDVPVTRVDAQTCRCLMMNSHRP